MLAHVFQKGHEYPEGQTKFKLFPIRKEVCAFWKVAPSSALTWYAMKQGNQELETALSFNQYSLKDAADNGAGGGWWKCTCSSHLPLAFLHLQMHIQMYEITLH